MLGGELVAFWDKEKPVIFLLRKAEVGRGRK